MSKSFVPPQLPYEGDVSSADDDANALSDAIDSGFDSLGGYFEHDENAALFNLAVAGSTDYSVAHGLASLPFLNTLRARCTSAEHGYVGNDMILISHGHHFGASSTPMLLSWVDGTNFEARTSGATNPLSAVSKATFQVVNLTAANWNIYSASDLLSASTRNDFTPPATVSGTSDNDDLNNITAALDTSFTAVESDIAGSTYIAGSNKESFVSSLQTITAGTVITLAHGLSSEPYILSVAIQCISSDLGYSVGEEVIISHQPGCNIFSNGAGVPGNGGITVQVDSTNVYLVIPNYTGDSIGVADLTDTSDYYERKYIDNTKWKVCVKAWA